MQHPLWLAKPDNAEEAQTAEDVATYIRQQWQTAQENPGLREALLQIYARSAELLIERINRLPENYFRAFLNEAGVDRLPPKPARAEVTFQLPAEGGPAYVVAPAGTQVATQPSADKAEVIFETTEDLVVTPNRLVKCVTFDAHRYRDVTALVTSPGNKTPFQLFTGVQERERRLYVGDERFTYPTAAEEEQPNDFVRAQTHFDLYVEVAMPLLFHLELAGQPLTPGPVPASICQQFKKHDHPLTAAACIEETYHGVEMVNSEQRTVVSWSIKDNNAYYSVREKNQAFDVYARLPLNPTRKLTWLYWNAEQKPPGWVPLVKEPMDQKQSVQEQSADQPTITDGTNAFQNDGVIRFTRLPTLTKSPIEGVESYWLACQLSGDPADLPTITRIRLARTLAFAPTQTIPIEAALAGTQGGTIFTPLLPSTTEAPAMLPFGPLPQRLDAFYLRADHAFRQASAVVQLTFQLESIPDHLRDLIGSRYERKLAATLPQIAWEYYTKAGWQTIKEVKPKLTWSDLPDKGWSITDITHDPSDQEQDDDPPYKPVDPTHGFLELGEHTIALTLGEAKPALLTINEQTGYWLRARLVVGAYGLPGEMQRFLRWATEWTPPITFAPLIQGLTLRARLPQEAVFYPLEYCFSRVDQCWGTTIEQANGKSWRTKPILAKDWQANQDNQANQANLVTAWQPFTARDDGPALYLGFVHAFPVKQWIQLFFDVAEQAADETAPDGTATLHWRFWHGPTASWQPLQPVSDDTKALTQANYLGFYAPADHDSSSEFGLSAYWLRVTYGAATPPQAGVISDHSSAWWARINPTNKPLLAVHPNAPYFAGTKPTTTRPAITIWRKGRFTPSRELAAIVEQQRLRTAPTLLWRRATTAEETITIDASPSRPSDPTTAYIAKYTLRRPRPHGYAKAAVRVPAPAAAPRRHLHGVRLNTVTAINKQTITDVVIGRSNGQANQTFQLVRRPVLDQVSNGNRYERFPQGAQTMPYELVLEVQEFAPPTLSTPTAQPPKTGEQTAEQQWRVWRRVNHFAEADKDSRVYLLDAIEGVITFGDGERGLIPLAGNAIRVRQYCTHVGSEGNVGAREIGVLRNPSGDLAKIERVTNDDPSSGGRATETVADVLERGPRAMKNQGRVVSSEDLEWLAHQSVADIIGAHALPIVDHRGRPQSGRAGVVILPRQEAAQPQPTLSQRRAVKEYLAQYIQANLKEADALSIHDPSYVKVNATVWLVPKKPEQAEQLQRMVRDCLHTFLHPLKGGVAWGASTEQRWPFGRDLFVSQIHAQLEGLPAVDYVNRVRLESSMMQYQLHLGSPKMQLFMADELAATLLPAGTQVSTLDEHKKLLLSESCLLSALLNAGGLAANTSTVAKDQEQWQTIHVHGFNCGDAVDLRAAEDAVVVRTRIDAVKNIADPVTNQFTACFTITMHLAEADDPTIAMLQQLRDRVNEAQGKCVLASAALARNASMTGQGAASHGRVERRVNARLPCNQADVYLTTANGRVRLPVKAITEMSDQRTQAVAPTAGGQPAQETVAPAPITFVCQVEGLLPHEFVSLFLGRRRLDLLWPIQAIADTHDRIYVPDGYLLSSGQHHVNLELSKVSS